MHYVSFLIGYSLISEKTLHPTGVDFPMKDIRTGNGFSSATDSYDTVSAVDQINRKLQRESCSDDEVDIVSTGSARI